MNIQFCTYSIQHVNKSTFQLMIDVVARGLLIRGKLVHEIKRDEEAGSDNPRAPLINDDKDSLMFGSPKKIKDPKCRKGEIHTPAEEYEILDHIQTSIATDIQFIREAMENFYEKKLLEVNKDKIVHEWRVICCITDRLFFVLYVIINLIGICVIFMGG